MIYWFENRCGWIPGAATFNIAKIADRPPSPTGRIWKDQSRAKIGNARRGKRLSSEHRAKLSESHKGIVPTAENVAKRAAKMTGENNPQFGKPLAPNVREKISASLRGRKRPPELVERSANAIRGRKRSPEVVEKIRVAQSVLHPFGHEKLTVRQIAGRTGFKISTVRYRLRNGLSLSEQAKAKAA